MKTVIEMAREAGAWSQQSKNCDVEYVMSEASVKRFAELFRADERNRTWTQEHWTEYELSIAAQEREAIDQLVNDDKELSDKDAIRVSKAIRARGQA
jgi:hypothetical protein